MKGVVCVAHRGGGKGIYENRLETIRKTLRKEYVDAIEVDVRLTKDNILVVHHDRGVYINGKRRWVDKIHYSKIKHLGVPTFEEVFQLVGRSDKILDIDVKDESAVPQLKDFFKRNGFKKKLLFSCHDLDALLDLQVNLPNGEYYLTLHPKDSRDFTRRFPVRVVLLLMAIFFNQLIIYLLKKKLKRVKLDGVSVPYQFAKKGFIKDLKDFGFKVITWGTDDEPSIRRCLAAGVDGIKTRDVRVLKKLQ